MTLPKVSIVIPSYKPAHFEQCLRSALGQTYLNTEILVSDNCPTEAIRDICLRYPGVHYQRNTMVREQNVLSSYFGCKGDLIKPLFDDDLLHPFCVERMVSAMQMDPATELVFSATEVINADNQRIETRRPYPATGSMAGRAMYRNMALNMCNVIGEFTSIMFRRARLWQLGPHRLFAIGSHDFALGLADVAAYCNLADGGNVFYIDEELSYFRRDQRIDSNSNPLANPNFGLCFSDYIDLLRVAHETGVITDAELLATEPTVDSVDARLGAVFAQVGQARSRYLALLAPLRPVTVEGTSC